MNIPLPLFFVEKLHGHSHEQGIVHSALSSFGSFFESSGTPIFFRDYTNHGVKHLTEVLATAAAMIPVNAGKTFTAADSTILILATLLHDAALHIAEPGFHHLILGDAKDRRMVEFDATIWPALWDEFLFTARRWDDRKLANIFGDQFVQEGRTVANPFERWGNLNQADCKLIGEFIRLHHPRLAHEFAVYGMPGIEADFLKLPSEASKEWRDLSGLVARSHGLPLRVSVDYIEKHYHKRDYQGIHATYLMALLRLADYLQIDATRAPAVVFRYRVIPSRISDLEWRTHNSVKNITPEHEDPESVEVHAEPPDVEAYLRLREWLDGIQYELDSSWAVLGEVYGRYPALKELGLHWRRIRSNLDDRAVFARSVSFLPRRIRIEVARAELLSLLIRPLYGDDPSYGVRELIQNAVDAVREREFHQQKYPESSKEIISDQRADVVVWLTDFDNKTNCAWLVVSDRGIGMTEKILTDYFLTAGASYRHSEQWQKIFERSDPSVGSKPRAQIIRTGRFGVGALAAFLLGENIEVQTRHISSATGFRFSMSLTQEAVQVERVDDLPVGTLIRVCVGRDAFEKLDRDNGSVTKPRLWDWYILSKPSVVRLRGSQKRQISNGLAPDLSEWGMVETNLPMTIHWAFDVRAPSLSCNGIYVSRSDKLPEITARHCDSNGYFVCTPLIHVSDPDGHLPLSLTRKELFTEEYGFERDLYQSMMKDWLALMLARFPEKMAAYEIEGILKGFKFRTSAQYSYNVSPDCLICTEGFCLTFSNAAQTISRPIENILWIESANALSLVADVSEWDCILFANGLTLPELGTSYPGPWASNIQKYLQENKEGLSVCGYKFTDNTTSFIKSKQQPHTAFEEWVEWEAVEKGTGKRAKRQTRWLVWSQEFRLGKYPFEALQKIGDDLSYSIPFVAEFTLASPWKGKLAGGILDYWWQRYFGDQLIPWNKSDRRLKFPKAYEELAPYIARYKG